MTPYIFQQLNVTNLLYSFVFFFIVFGLLEKFFPMYRQKIFRKGWLTDSVHFFVTHVLAKVGLAVTIGIFFASFGFLLDTGFQEAVHRQPIIVQFFEAIFVGEVVGYWLHRFMHRIPILWRFHSIHHSSEALDWLAAVRLHPFDQIFIRTAQFAVLALFGFDRALLGGYLIFAIFQSIFIHANVKINFGPLKWLISTPEFHHWHHSAAESEYNSNYGFFPFSDWMFGTLYMPQNKKPEAYGTKEGAPSGYVGQILAPFKKRKTLDL